MGTARPEYNPQLWSHIFDVCHTCGNVAPMNELTPLEGEDGSIIGFICEDHY